MASKRIFSDKSLTALWKAIVDQVEPKQIGKHLSENDLTDEDKEAIENIDQHIREQINGVYLPQGSVKYVDLPKHLTELEAGFVYNITNQFISNDKFVEGERYTAFPPGTNVIWTGSEWDVLAGVPDFSEFQMKSEIENFSLEELLEIANTKQVEHEHKFYDRIIKTPTCNKSGIRRWSCIYNDEYYDEEVPATGIHEYLETITKEVSHLEDGTKRCTCSSCGTYYDEVIPRITEHTYETYVAKQPTCIDLGKMVYTCICGDTYDEIIPYIEHNYVDNICTICGKHQYEDFILSINTYKMCGLDDLDGETIIPTRFEYEGNLYQVTRVVYPNGVSYISHDVAAEHPYLTSVGLPSTVREIGERAFYRCVHLEKVEMSNVTTIGTSAFEECTKLSTLSNYQYWEAYIGAQGTTYNTVPDCTNAVGEAAFKGCVSLTPFYIHPNIRNIGENALLSIDQLAIDRKSTAMGAPWGAIHMQIIDITN